MFLLVFDIICTPKTTGSTFLGLKGTKMYQFNIYRTVCRKMLVDPSNDRRPKVSISVLYNMYP